MDLRDLQLLLQSMTNAVGYLDLNQPLSEEQAEHVHVALARIRTVLMEQVQKNPPTDRTS